MLFQLSAIACVLRRGSLSLGQILHAKRWPCIEAQKYEKKWIHDEGQHDEKNATKFPEIVFQMSGYEQRVPNNHFYSIRKNVSNGAWT